MNKMNFGINLFDMPNKSSEYFTQKDVFRDAPESPIHPVWKTNLYKLQQEAPRPHPVVCDRNIFYCPPEYGPIFHGTISHSEAAKLLMEEGFYLVRKSGGGNGCYTLSLRFGDKIRHYKLYYDGQHYVRDKKFDTLYDLVADGLVTMYIELKGGAYIELMYSFTNYEKSPYMTLNRCKRRALSQRKEISSIDQKDGPSCEVTENQLNQQRTVEDDDLIEYEKSHAFKVHTFKGLNWCEFCGNFLWGFTAQGVKCEDCGFSAHNKCSEKVPNDCCPDLKHIRGVFGIDLTTLVKAHHTVRPFIVEKCINEIESRGLDAEGLYRVSGFAEEIETLKLALDRDAENADIGPDVCDNINVIAGILKLYFRLLPIPLITFEAHPPLLDAAKLRILAERIEAIKDALALLPPAHHNTLKYLMEHLNKVVQLQDVNKMTAHNLSTVFAPTLIPAPDLSKGIPGMTLEICALETMITHHIVIFS